MYKIKATLNDGTIEVLDNTYPDFASLMRLLDKCEIKDFTVTLSDND